MMTGHAMSRSLAAIISFASLLISPVISSPHPPSSVFSSPERYPTLMNTSDILFKGRILDRCHDSSFPPRPECDRFLPHDKITRIGAINIWKIDVEDKSQWGIILWKEKVSTSTWQGFFGDTDRLIDSTVSLPWDEDLSAENKTFMSNAPLDSIMTLRSSPSNVFDWSWLRTTKVSATVLYGMRVMILRDPRGGFRKPEGPWRKVNRNHYETKYKALYLFDLTSEEHCPLKVYQTAPVVVTNPGDEALVVSANTLMMQFSIRLDPQYILCRKNNIPIYQSLGGYMVTLVNKNGDLVDSFTQLMDETRKSWNNKARTRRSTKINMIKDLITFLSEPPQHSRRMRRDLASRSEPYFDESMRRTFDYASFRYEIDFLIKSENKNLAMIHHQICLIRETKWLLLTPPDLPDKVAAYVTSDIFAKGNFSAGRYRVCPTIPISHTCALVRPVQIQKGMVKVECGKQHRWMEPISGLLYLWPFRSVNSLRATWIPIDPTGGYDILTDTIIHDETHVDELIELKQITAHTSENMYSFSEYLAEEAHRGFVLPSSVTEDDSSSWWSWMNFFSNSHFVTIIGAALGFFMLLPHFLICLSSCCGETTEVEKTSLFRVR